MTDPRDTRIALDTWKALRQAQADLADARAEIVTLRNVGVTQAEEIERFQQRLGECEAALDTGQRAIADNITLRAEIEQLRADAASLRDANERAVVLHYEMDAEIGTLRAQLDAARAGLVTARDCLDDLCDKLAEAEKALEPLANAADEFAWHKGDPEQVYLWAQSGQNAKCVSVADARRAREALARIRSGSKENTKFDVSLDQDIVRRFGMQTAKRVKLVRLIRQIRREGEPIGDALLRGLTAAIRSGGKEGG